MRCRRITRSKPISAAGIRDGGKTPLFRSAAGRTGTLTSKAMNRIDAWRMIQRRAADLGTRSRIGCHTFRATGITVKDLDQVPQEECQPKSVAGDKSLDTEHFQGSSLLLESDLGIQKWLANAVYVRTALGVSAPIPTEVLSYDVKFEIVSSGNVTPTWKLVRISANTGSSPLFNTKRDRTHEMLLTFGPVSKGPGGKVQPSTLAANDALAQQIGSAVGVAVTTALARAGVAP